jgi:serine/threonine-protein kinase
VSSEPKRTKRPSGPPPWNFDEEFSGSEDIVFEDLPQAVAEALQPPPPAEGNSRSSRPPRKTLPPEVPGWPPDEGTILLGKYKVEKVLGKGGMGVVVVARHLQLQQKVAIKFLHPSAMSDPDVVTRFQREARILAQIQSEHVVRILDVGTLDKGEPFMVMEYLEGTDLSKTVKVRGPLPYDEAVDYVIQACEPLAEAHLQRIIHRDLKPSNLYLARRADGTYTVKVIDFGISKIQTEAELSMTKTSVILGSPLYISPEQLRSARDVDARSDIWALGVILYKLLTGHPPFIADSIAQLCAMILMNPPPRVSESRPDVPGALEDVMARCINKDPDRRFQNVGDLVEALLPFCARDAEAHESVARIRRLLKTAPKIPSMPPVPILDLGKMAGPQSDGGAALTLGGSAAAYIPPSRDHRARRAILTAAGAGFAFFAVVALVLVVVRGRVPHPDATPAATQTEVLLPPPTKPVDTTPEPSADPVIQVPTVQPPFVPPSAAAPIATPSAQPSASAKRQQPQPPAWTGAPKKPPKPVDNTEFGDRK